MSAEPVTAERRAELEPQFQILGVEPVVPALTPSLRFDMHVSDPLGRDIVTIALSTQIQVEPVKRRYDAATRARMTDLFGAPERWAATTHAFEWGRVEALVPGFTGATSFELRLPVSYDLEIMATRFAWSLPDGGIPLAMHFSGMVMARDEDGRLQVERVPWSCSARWTMPVESWRRAVTDQFPAGNWIRLTEPTMRALAERRAAGGNHSFDELVAELLGMSTDVDELVTTLLWEGYALYPYTPGATKNATPTPFGIVYPPAYAAGAPTTFDHARLRCVADGLAAAKVAVEARFLVPSGVRHEAAERRVTVAPTALGTLAQAPVVEVFDGGELRVEVDALPDGLWRVSATLANLADVPAGLDRAEALRSSLLSAQLVARIEGARFASPITPFERATTAVMASQSTNTFPVLAADDDTVVLGTTIMLPDHPQIAPESKGDLFDATEIEEALRLHLMALSDGERAELAEHDPALRQMLERAIERAPQDLAGLHGRVTMSDGPRVDGAGREVNGEDVLVVEGRRFERGGRVRLLPGAARVASSHGHDVLVEGRTATVERILTDVEDGVHICVTIDDDPGQQLMRDIGRYLYFKPTEVVPL